MGSILIKPVQRILKYPLILNELIKVNNVQDLIVESHATYLLILINSVISFQCTEEDHGDKEDLRKAVTIMADVAAFINESKRRKDIGKETYCTLLMEYRIKG